MKTIVVAKALLLDADGNALLLRRSKTHPTLALQPDLPGGEIEQGEEPDEALVREISEETGMIVAASDLRLLFAATEVQHGDSYVRLLFVAKLAAQKPQIELSWEHDKAAWVTPADVPNLEERFNSFGKDALAHLRKYKLLEDD